MPLHEITTPLDAAKLDSSSQYELYYALVKHVLDEFEINLVEWDHEDICTDEEVKLLEDYCKRLAFSIRAMELKYRFDDEKLQIDLTESGFPNYLELRYIHNDLDLKEAFTSKLPDAAFFKEKFLKRLLKEKKHIDKRDLFEAASSLYYNSIEDEKIFKKIIIGNIQKITNSAANYRIDWAFYDVTLNRPFVCFMYFDATPDAKTAQDIKGAIKDCGDRFIDLDNMAYVIDKRLKNVNPRSFKRVDLGILHSIFSKDDHIITQTLLKAIAEKSVTMQSFALSATIENIATVNSSKVSNELLSFKKQEIQIWSDVKKHQYILAPHRVIQLLYDRIPDTVINYHHDPFEVEELTE